MGRLRNPIPVKLFIGMLAQDIDLLQECIHALIATYGPCDQEGPLLPWDHTDYYRAEMGSSLLRKFYFFERLMDPGELADVKLLSIKLEGKHARQGAERPFRRINLDPGYVTEAKVVLATTKDFSHRIYIGKGVFAEVTLRYDKQARAFQTFEHTYPDFRSPAVRSLFLDARRKLREDLSRDSR